MTHRRLTGWGRTGATWAEVVRPSNVEELARALREAGPRGVVPRGLGRAYGDAAQNAGGTVIDTAGLDSSIRIGPDGVAHLGGATTLDEVMRTGLPQGWFVPVTPGTRQVSLGGAVAADIHGKNHHVAGSFGSHIRRMTLVTPGGVRELTPADDLFWATTGGMGLTGVVADADITMTGVETSRMSVDTDRTRDLEETLAEMAERDHLYRYTVAWIDCLSRGRSMGRAVLTRGDHATLDQLPAKHRADPLAFAPRPPLPTPPWAPSGLLNPVTISAFNEVWYRRFPKRERGAIQTIGSFFHPLDGVASWNRLYGRRGFLQYQTLIPFGREDVLRRMVETLSAERCPSFLGVLKRFGPADAGHLSFPGPGWTLALDMPAGYGPLAELLDRLDEEVANAGGRVYLAKDSRLRPELLEVMYPRLAEWRRVREQADPDGVMCSDLSRRLGVADRSWSRRQRAAA